jgi:chemotaxis signal transduction protein
LEALPAMIPPVTGMLELRGNPLPVVDLRAGDAEELRTARGDVLVLAEGVDALGVVVDQVTAVHDATTKPIWWSPARNGRPACRGTSSRFCGRRRARRCYSSIYAS